MHKRIITIVAAVTAVAALIVPATSVAGHGGPHPLVFCINNMNVSEGQDIVPFTRLLPGAKLDPIILNDASAVLLRFFINKGGQFRLVDKAGNVATDFNTVSEGACAAAVVSLDRKFWLCYSRSQVDPADYSRGQAITNYEAGMTVPFAVREPLSKTRLNSGLYLVCNLPAGYAVQNGVAVSTGGGEITTGPPALVSFMLGVMPLDYTRLATRS